MAQQNKIDAVLAPEDKRAVLDLILKMEERLHFLVALSAEERHELPKMGDRSQAFVHKTVEVAREHPEVLPEDFDVEGLARDVALYDALQPIVFAIMQLQELLVDTITAAGSDAYVTALQVYEAAQAAQIATPLDALMTEMKVYFTEQVELAQEVTEES